MNRSTAGTCIWNRISGRGWTVRCMLGLLLLAGWAGAEKTAAPAGHAPADAPETADNPAAMPSENTMIWVPVETWRAVVREVDAGDIVTLDHDGTTVQARLYGIDAPDPGQDGFEAARDALSSGVKGQEVSVAVLVDKDSTGMPVVSLAGPGETQNWSLRMVQEGLAWWDEDNVPDDRFLKKAAAAAITAGTGIWSGEVPLSPRDYRRSHRLPDFKYTMKGTEPEPKPEPPKQEVKELAAKGTAEYRGTYTLPPGTKWPENVKPEDLLIRHAPTIAMGPDGKPLGLTAQDISQIPFARELGFQDGDIISEVNGIPVQSIPQIVQMAPQFRGVKQFNVKVLRNGTVVPITIDISNL